MENDFLALRVIFRLYSYHTYTYNISENFVHLKRHSNSISAVNKNTSRWYYYNTIVCTERRGYGFFLLFVYEKYVIIVLNSSSLYKSILYHLIEFFSIVILCLSSLH